MSDRQRVIWWLRRDLRLSDNVALAQALAAGAAVVPVFVLDSRLLAGAAPARRAFLFDALADLDARLRKRGSYLVVRRGNPAQELPALAREAGAGAVYFHRDLTPYARRRDVAVERALAVAGIDVRSFSDGYLAAPEDVVKADGMPYTVYTPYRRRFEQVVPLPETYTTGRPLHTPPGLASYDWRALAPAPVAPRPRGGETAGLARAKTFLQGDGLPRYAETRDILAADATSHLSADLHFGTVSVRALVRDARAARAEAPPAARRSIDVWLGELIWREFYAQVLWHFPHAARGAFRRAYDALRWENDPERFAAWCAGRTGFPIVDAAMRELNVTGFMHNRARMIVASFLTKDLLIDWRWGERYFLQHLVDGDVANNNGGWQWAAGTGTDAQPFFRIFNPIAQAKRYDPQGEYVRRWVPEVDDADAYPAPIVDHSAQRRRALALYRGGS